MVMQVLTNNLTRNMKYKNNLTRYTTTARKVCNGAGEKRIFMAESKKNID